MTRRAADATGSILRDPPVAKLTGAIVRAPDYYAVHDKRGPHASAERHVERARERRARAFGGLGKRRGVDSAFYRDKGEPLAQSVTEREIRPLWQSIGLEYRS